MVGELVVDARLPSATRPAGGGPAARGSTRPHHRYCGWSAVLLELPIVHDEDEVVTRAARHGLAIEGLRSYAAGPVKRGSARPACSPLVAGCSWWSHLSSIHGSVGRGSVPVTVSCECVPRGPRQHRPA
jgi:hypothetical protein